jgi:hypothetical protein
MHVVNELASFIVNLLLPLIAALITAPLIVPVYSILLNIPLLILTSPAPLFILIILLVATFIFYTSKLSIVSFPILNYTRPNDIE